MRIKIYILLLILGIATVSCDGQDNNKNDFSFVIFSDADQTSETIEKDWHLNANVGDIFLLRVTDGRETWGWLKEYDLSVSDPSVVTVDGGVLAIKHGGESTVTLEAEGHETSFTISAPTIAHGKIYLTYDAEEQHDESDSFFPPHPNKLFVDGAMTDEDCHLVAADTRGNLWQATYTDGLISFKLNGLPVGEGVHYTKPDPRLPLQRVLLAKAVKSGLALCLKSNSEDRYCVIAPDGTVREGTVGGYVTDIGEDPQGNITMWGLWYARGTVWRISPDGTVSTKDAPGDDHNILNAGFDDLGNEYVMCRYWNEELVIFKNGEILYRFKDALFPKMIICGNDVIVAYFSEKAGGGYDLYLFKNGESKQLTDSFTVYMDLCLSSGDTPYVAINTNYGFCIFRESKLVMFIPCLNGILPSLAVID